MWNHRSNLVVAVCLTATLGGACAARTPAAPLGAEAAGSTPQVFPRRVQTVPASSVEGVLALSEQYFAEGQAALRAGHLDAARAAFDRALEVLLERPGGARADGRLRDHFDRLVERISAQELSALAQGDGFTEKPSDPAAIDELLAVSTFGAPEATPQTAQAVADDLRAVAHDIDIPLNKKVLSFVELYTGRFKRSIEEGLGRGAQYLPMIQRILLEEGLPLDLAYVPLVESAFRPLALSRASAHGIWQFMRTTALENGLVYDWYVDERADPEKATRAAARYLRTLHDMFGDWHLALAAYNGGPGRVQRAVQRSGLDDFWSLSASSRFLPRETRDYVPLVLAAIVVARSPSAYGVEIRPLAAAPHETITVGHPVDLRRVAEWIDAPVEEVQRLNPELRRWTTPIGPGQYVLRLPAGTAGILDTRLAALGPDDLLPLTHYIVRRGDTLSGVAKQLKVSRYDLADANYLSRDARLQIGQELIVPRGPTLLTASTTPPASRTSEPSQAGPSGVQTVALAAPGAGDVHRVRRGDTLFSIARHYRTTVALLKQWNDLGSNLIQIGQQLRILRPPTTY